MLNQVWIRAGVCGNVVTVTHNTTINLTCSGSRTPDWFVNGTEIDTTGHRYKLSTNSADKTATLTINGNRTCETVNVHCEVYNMAEGQFFPIHNTTLRFQGWLQLV